MDFEGPQQPTPEKRADIEAERTISDAELLKEGAKYTFDQKGDRRLEVTSNQIKEGKEEMNFEKQLETNTEIRKEIESIYTEISLPKEKNRGSDCGPLSIEMLLRADFGDKTEFSLEEIEKGLGKRSNTPSLPGKMCEFLRKHGYEVTYHSEINWESVSRLPYEEWDEKVKKLFTTNHGLLERIGENDLRDSASWLIENRMLGKSIDVSEIAEKLRGSFRIIALMREGRHAVVITGVDKEKIYINDPSDEAKRVLMTHNEFEKTWNKDIIAAKILNTGETKK